MAAASELAPFRLRPSFSQRIWGKRDLAPWYPGVTSPDPIGEAWLTGPESVIETGPLAGSTLAQAAATHAQALLGSTTATDFPLLVKILFPAEKLSVQVHPDDARARQIGQPRGKTECWYVLESDPGASVALGLIPGTTPEALRAATLDHTLESLLRWLPVTPGDMIYVDAGTVHAIGPGMTLLEIQQSSDTTYRLYDYGRPRELHLDDGLLATKTETAAGKIDPIVHNGFTRLIGKQYFTADRFDLDVNQHLALIQPAVVPQCLIALNGHIAITAAGSQPITLQRGQAAILPATCREISIVAKLPTTLIHTFPSSAQTN